MDLTLSSSACTAEQPAETATSAQSEALANSVKQIDTKHMKSTIEFDLSNETHRAAIRAMLDTLDGTAPQQVTGSAEPQAPAAAEQPKRKKADKVGAGTVVLNPTPAEPSTVLPESERVDSPEPTDESLAGFASAFKQLDGMLGASAKANVETPVQPVAETPTAQTAVTVEQVRKAVSEITTAHPDKRETVRGILGEFGAENVSTLDASNYAAFLERLKTV